MHESVVVPSIRMVHTWAGMPQLLQYRAMSGFNCWTSMQKVPPPLRPWPLCAEYMLRSTAPAGTGHAMRALLWQEKSLAYLLTAGSFVTSCCLVNVTRLHPHQLRL